MVVERILSYVLMIFPVVTCTVTANAWGRNCAAWTRESDQLYHENRSILV